MGRRWWLIEGCGGGWGLNPAGTCQSRWLQKDLVSIGDPEPVSVWFPIVRSLSGRELRHERASAGSGRNVRAPFVDLVKTPDI